MVGEVSSGFNTADRAELVELARRLSELFVAVRVLASEVADGDGLLARLEAHLGTDPRTLPVISQELPSYQLVDVQIALDTWASLGMDRDGSVVGISGDQRRFHPLSEMLSIGHLAGIGLGPVDYVDLADSPDTTRRCVRFGLFLLRDGMRSAGVLLRGPDPHGPIQSAMMEVVSSSPDFGQEVLAELRRLAVERSVLRGAVLGLGEGDGQHYGALRFMRRPTLRRDELVLPDVTLANIERHVMGIARHRDRLQAAGQHLKRGVLLYGPPGTGKTHTVRYLLAQLTGVTAFVLSGQALGLIGQACTLARLLQPSLVVLEDVDLLAPDRSFGPVGAHPLLFEVLNQIDGLGDDVDVTFLLTTNRVDLLERALSERPGRVDAAVQISPPDGIGRARLFRLYGAGVGVDALTDTDLAEAVAATDGRTATYIREVVRRAALQAAEDDQSGALRVNASLLVAAARDLLDDRAALTRVVLGGAHEPDAEPPLFTPARIVGVATGGMMRGGAWSAIAGTTDDAPPFAPKQ